MPRDRQFITDLGIHFSGHVMWLLSNDDMSIHLWKGYLNKNGTYLPTRTSIRNIFMHFLLPPEAPPPPLPHTTTTTYSPNSRHILSKNIHVPIDYIFVVNAGSRCSDHQVRVAFLWVNVIGDINKRLCNLCEFQGKNKSIIPTPQPPPPLLASQVIALDKVTTIVRALMHIVNNNHLFRICRRNHYPGQITAYYVNAQSRKV